MLRNLPNNTYTIWKIILKYVETPNIISCDVYVNKLERVKEAGVGVSTIQWESSTFDWARGLNVVLFQAVTKRINPVPKRS